MKSHVQFITTPTADTPGTSLVLHFDNKRYLLGNIHEGLQRACVERQLKLVKVSDIFLSGRTDWKNVGGLMGIILTLADAVSPLRVQESLDRQRDIQRLALHGGRNLLYLLATMRSFVLRQSLPVEVNEYSEKGSEHLDPSSPTWRDDNIKVWAIPITPKQEFVDDQKGFSPLRKRNYLDYLENELPAEIGQTTKTTDLDSRDLRTKEADEYNQKTKFLKGVISDMFESDWKLDALFKVPLYMAPSSGSLFVQEKETGRIEEYKGPRPGPGKKEPIPQIHVLIRKPWPGQQIKRLPCGTPSVVSMCYLIRNHPQRGKFLPAKARELKVKPGPDFGRLASGQSVISESGETIMPEQVLGPGKVGGGFIVADLPSADYIDSFLNRPEWYMDDVTEGVEAFIWILGPKVAIDPRLQEFISNYKQVEHIISSADHSANYVAFDSSAAATIRHCQLDPVRFGTPVHDNRSPQLPPRLSHCTVAQRGLIVQLEPSVKVQHSSAVPPLNTAIVVNETSSKALNLAKTALRKTISDDYQRVVEAQQLPGSEAEIIALGTGSALPSKYRNVSSTLLRVPGSGSYLLDCGENTLGQLTRMYTAEELREIFQSLRMIWVSHMHADHHLGLVPLIKAWHTEVHGPPNGASTHLPLSHTEPEDLLKHLNEKSRLAIVSEDAIIDFLEEYSEIENFGYDGLTPLRVQSKREGITNDTKFYWHGVLASLCDETEASPEVVSAMRSYMGLQDLQSANVEHTRNSRGVALTFPGGFKVTFSGDCRPSKQLVEIGMDSTVLVHEATFEDELIGDAIAKKHSTTSEAVEIGVAMRARRILLTHFSQRYQKIPSTQDTGLPIAGSETSGTGDKMNSTSSDGENVPSSFLPSPEGPRTADAATSPWQALRPAGNVRKLPFDTTDVPNQGPLVDTKVAVAFDFMKVKVKDLASLEHFAPALTQLYEVNQGRP